MFELTAEDAAAEDMFYYVNRALENNLIDLETFLKVSERYITYMKQRGEM